MAMEKSGRMIAIVFSILLLTEEMTGLTCKGGPNLIFQETAMCMTESAHALIQSSQSCLTETIQQTSETCKANDCVEVNIQIESGVFADTDDKIWSVSGCYLQEMELRICSSSEINAMPTKATTLASTPSAVVSTTETTLVQTTVATESQEATSTTTVSTVATNQSTETSTAQNSSTTPSAALTENTTTLITKSTMRPTTTSIKSTTMTIEPTTTTVKPTTTTAASSTTNAQTTTSTKTQTTATTSRTTSTSSVTTNTDQTATATSTTFVSTANMSNLTTVTNETNNTTITATPTTLTSNLTTRITPTTTISTTTTRNLPATSSLVSTTTNEEGLVNFEGCLSASVSFTSDSCKAGSIKVKATWVKEGVTVASNVGLEIKNLGCCNTKNCRVDDGSKKDITCNYGDENTLVPVQCDTACYTYLLKADSGKFNVSHGCLSDLNLKDTSFNKVTGCSMTYDEGTCAEASGKSECLRCCKENECNIWNTNKELLKSEKSGSESPMITTLLLIVTTLTSTSLAAMC